MAMNHDVYVAANDCLLNGGNSLVQMYTDTALLLNACAVSAIEYEKRKDDFHLSTTKNIPKHLRLPVEPEIIFHRDDLAPVYKDQVLQRIAEDFVIRMISLIDATFEDIYEAILPILVPGISEIEITKKIRSAWQQDTNGHVKLLNFLIDDASLVSPVGRQSTLQMVFDRYYEIREIRHALVHTSGELSQKHLTRLKQLSERLPENLRNGSLASASFLQTGRILLSANDIIQLRYWAYTTIFDYFREAFNESKNTPQ